MRSTWVANTLLPNESVKIGRLVLDFENPEDDCYDPVTEFPIENEITSSKLEGFHDIGGQEKTSTFRIFLTKLLAGSFNIQGNVETEVESAVCTTYRLKNSGNYFETTCKSSAARKWLGQAIRRGRKVYLVVGIKTLSEAQITIRVKQSIAGEAKLDISELLARTIPVGSGNAIDVGASVSGIAASNKTLRFMAPETQIYAVQFRKVRFSFFSPGNLDKAQLQRGNRWEVYLGGRGDGGADQVVEAQVQESSSVEVEDLESECERLEFGDEEILYIA